MGVDHPNYSYGHFTIIPLTDLTIQLHPHIINTLIHLNSSKFDQVHKKIQYCSEVKKTWNITNDLK